MKELSIEEKAKAYDNALERAKSMIDDLRKGEDILAVSDIESMFPGLKENEDENIKKEIINYFQCQSRDEPTRKDIHNKWIAWLENQNNIRKQIKNKVYSDIMKRMHELKDKADIPSDYDIVIHNMNIESEEDEKIRKTIEKALKGECCLSADETNRCLAWLENQVKQKSIDDLTPQEAMDIAVAKCFEQGEQKPAEEYNITDIGSKHAEGKLGEMIKKLKHDNEVLEQKPAWDYEDEANLNNIIWLCNNCINCSETTWIPAQAKKIKHLIETIKERGLAQQKSAWSEEDEKRLQSCLNILQAKGIMGVTETVNTKWLKSLKERYAWKPSDEQIRYLQAVVNEPKNAGAESCHNALAKLLGQLKNIVI